MMNQRGADRNSTQGTSAKKAGLRLCQMQNKCPSPSSAGERLCRLARRLVGLEVRQLGGLCIRARAHPPHLTLLEPRELSRHVSG